MCSTCTAGARLTLLGLDDGGAGVLAHRQYAAGGDGSVLEQVEGDETVVGGRSGSSRIRANWARWSVRR
jgi:hypothetical protein